MLKLAKFGLIPLVLGVGACSSNPQVEHEVACVGGTLAGAALGGAIGSRFGGGTGQALLGGAGAIAGGITAANAMKCGR